jgi:hypothetical protein
MNSETLFTIRIIWTKPKINIQYYIYIYIFAYFLCSYNAEATPVFTVVSCAVARLHCNIRGSSSGLENQAADLAGGGGQASRELAAAGVRKGSSGGANISNAGGAVRNGNSFTERREG